MTEFTIKAPILHLPLHSHNPHHHNNHQNNHPLLLQEQQIQPLLPPHHLPHPHLQGRQIHPPPLHLPPHFLLQEQQIQLLLHQDPLPPHLPPHLPLLSPPQGQTVLPL